MRKAAWMAVGFLVLGACNETSPLAPEARTAVARGNGVLSAAQTPTTDGSIALGNLSGEVDTLERQLARGQLDASRMPGLVQTLLMRGQYRGDIADYERAGELAQRCVQDWPGDSNSFLARAAVHAAFHRFDAASADLERARHLGARTDRIEASRASISQARGRYREALAARQRAADANPGILTLGALASVRADQGEIDEAQRLFGEAIRSYKDVSPFPVAWIWFQQAHMWMEEGRYEQAREFLQAAHQRLPGYAAAQGHLAEAEAALGNRATALALLRPLAQNSDDPYYAALLVRILLERGDATSSPERAEAQRWRELAVKRYEELLSAHPEAFADHAAEFYLGAGNDAKRALELARRNLDLRVTARSLRLALLAALATNDSKSACHYADQASALAYRPRSLRLLADHAYATCGRSPGA